MAVQEFRGSFPNVQLHLHQGSPKQVAQMLLDGEADVGIATEALSDYPQLVALPCFRWTHSVDRAARAIPLLDGPLTLERLAALSADHLRQRLHRPHAHRRGLRRRPACSPTWPSPRWTPTSSRPTWSSAWASGIVAGIAFEAERDTPLRAVDAGHLFGINLTKLAVRRGSYLRAYVYAFIESFAPTLPRAAVEEALGSRAADEGEAVPASALAQLLAHAQH